MNNNKIVKISAFKRTVYTEITIEAPIEMVWQELTNFKLMSTWSHSLQNIEGELLKDANIMLYFKDDFGFVHQYKRTLIHFETGKMFGWSGVFFCGMWDNHKYQLVKLDSNVTKLIQTDEVNGWATFLLGYYFSHFFLRSYTKFNKMLKARIEKKEIN
ncbi:MAG: hypothetical protein QM539_10075 [Alphaproteobacteria bacterium]|nr:hypothetical protein [Alphaproteobacteria bacterium]